MSWQAWVALVLFIIALIALAVRLMVRDKEDQALSGGATIVVFVLMFVFIILGSFTMVSTKNVGVVTNFGKPTGSLSNGIHFKWFWQNTTELDGAIQIDNHSGESATTVRLGNDSTAMVDNSIRWRIKPEQADQLFLDYREFDNIRDNLVTRELRAALNEVFSGFDPLSADARKEGKLGELSNQVAEKLRERVGTQIEVINVIIPLVNYDQETQNKINLLNAEVANTRVAEQKAKTAAAEAEANRILSASISNDPNVLVSKCLDIVKAQNQSPLGCWPGSSAVPTVQAR